MIFKCSECGGQIETIKVFDRPYNKSHNTFRCTQCGRERKIEEKIETIDMSETARLKVIME